MLHREQSPEQEQCSGCEPLQGPSPARGRGRERCDVQQFAAECAESVIAPASACESGAQQYGQQRQRPAPQLPHRLRLPRRFKLCEGVRPGPVERPALRERRGQQPRQGRACQRRGQEQQQHKLNDRLAHNSEDLFGAVSKTAARRRERPCERMVSFLRQGIMNSGAAKGNLASTHLPGMRRICRPERLLHSGDIIEFPVRGGNRGRQHAPDN